MITTSISEQIATVLIDRADRKNALTFEMFDQLAQAAQDIAERPEVRAVVLTGAGDAFCAGLDLGAMQAMAGSLDQVRADLARVDDAGANRFQRPVTAWAGLTVPVIAAVQGVCFGAGFQLALGADFRVMDPAAKLSVMEAKWGLIPDMGITQSLPKLVRADQAKWLMMTAQVFSGQDAHGMGLATELSDDPLARAHEMARALIQKSPEALAGAKRLVDDAWTGDVGLALEAELQGRLIGSANQIEAVMANLQKREPKFG